MPKNTLFAATAVAAIAGLCLVATASPSYAGSKKEESSKTVISKTTAHRVMVVKVDDGETLKLDGVDGASKIEVREEDGVQKLKAWDKDGKLVAEKSYAAGEKPFQSIVIVGKDGKEKTLEMPAIPEPPTPPDAPEWTDDETGERKVIIMKHKGDGEHEAHKIQCTDGDKIVEIETDEGADGDREVRKKVICIASKGGKPETRVKALEKAITEIEKDEALEPAEKADLLEDLKEALADAKADTRK